MRKNRLIACMLLLPNLCILTSCSEVAITGRQQLNIVPDSLMNSLSLQSYNDFLSQTKKSTDSQKNSMVNKVGKNVAAAVETYCYENNLSDRVKGFSWEFNLIDDPNENAWAMPGGKIVVYSGLLDITQSEAGLAVIMAHEVAHVIARHGSERMSQSLLVDMGGMALSQALAESPAKTQNLFLRSYSIGTQYGVLLPYSRTHETEADRLGLIFMALAGYNPNEAVALWQRMAANSKGPKPPELLSTHPADQTRIANIKSFLPEAMKYYNRSKTIY
ncbi:MAG: M48 family metallopeptidase [Planctomycetes bacterium]|nr:M48 family metallopeptidase [Planctomycetota bacterium]